MAAKHELTLIQQICDRALPQLEGCKRLDLFMDLDYAHQDIPINLADLLAADDGNFMHDVTGIVDNLNRQTLKLDNCFVPRYALREQA